MPAYDEMKTFKGKTYSGMAVGRTHVWDYPDGEWRERKLTPDLWRFDFASSKHRKGRGAPEGSGVPVGTGYHWFIEANQSVQELDANTYETLMEGLSTRSRTSARTGRRGAPSAAGRATGRAWSASSRRRSPR